MCIVHVSTIMKSVGYFALQHQLRGLNVTKRLCLEAITENLFYIGILALN